MYLISPFSFLFAVCEDKKGKNLELIFLSSLSSIFTECIYRSVPSLSCTLLSLQVFNSSFVLSVIKNGEVSGLGIVSENTAVLAAAC